MLSFCLLVFSHSICTCIVSIWLKKTRHPSVYHIFKAAARSSQNSFLKRILLAHLKKNVVSNFSRLHKRPGSHVHFCSRSCLSTCRRPGWQPTDTEDQTQRRCRWGAHGVHIFVHTHLIPRPRAVHMYNYGSKTWRLFTSKGLTARVLLLDFSSLLSMHVIAEVIFCSCSNWIWNGWLCCSVIFW